MSGKIQNTPIEYKDVKPEETEEILKYFQANTQEGFVRVGPKGYLYLKGYLQLAENVYNLALRPDDVWVITFPKSGTTVMQELVWMVANGCDYKKSKEIPLINRFSFLESGIFRNNKKSAELEKSRSTDKEAIPKVNVVEQAQSPRFFKSHLPLSLLPPALLDTCKVVHVARDPRDVAVSYYHFYKHFIPMGYTGDFKQFWNLFINNQIDETPFFENVKESWDQRHHPNMLFIFYEDLLKDLPSVVKRVADFLGKSMTEGQISSLCEHLSFDNFKKNNSVNGHILRNFNITTLDHILVRKGKAGGWTEYFDEEMTQQASRWMEVNLQRTDLKFPGA
ncbi:hypothetical protein ACJJTC_006575 [Scirpophaga incertulas]